MKDFASGFVSKMRVFQLANDLLYRHFKTLLRWLNTILAVFEYMSFAKLWQEKGCSSQAETWQVENILMKDFD